MLFAMLISYLISHCNLKHNAITVYYLSRNIKQPILSSSYLGFGNGSLARDTDEIVKLMDYLVCHHSAKEFAMVGHSTGKSALVVFYIKSCVQSTTYHMSNTYVMISSLSSS